MSIMQQCTKNEQVINALFDHYGFIGEFIVHPTEAYHEIQNMERKRINHKVNDMLEKITGLANNEMYKNKTID